MGRRSTANAFLRSQASPGPPRGRAGRPAPAWPFCGHGPCPSLRRRGPRHCGSRLEHRFSVDRDLDSQQGARLGQVNQIDKVRAEDSHQALAQQLLVKSPAGQVAEVPVGLAVDVSQDARAEEHQQTKTGLPGRLCQRPFGNHGPLLRDPTEGTTHPHRCYPLFPACLARISPQRAQRSQRRTGGKEGFGSGSETLSFRPLWPLWPLW
jgi:hypothetical protein